MLKPRDMKLVSEEQCPRTMAELAQWVSRAGAAGIPDPRGLGFAFGREANPGEYGVNSGAFYRRQPSGELECFYRGDEATAISGFWHTYLERLGLWQPTPEQLNKSAELLRSRTLHT